MTKQATARRARSAPDQKRKLRKLVVIDLLKGWTIPLVAFGVALLAWPLAVAGLLATGPALLVSFAALLIAVLHMGMTDFVDERTTFPTVATLLTFAALWAFVAWEPVATKLSPGPEVFAGELPLNAAAPTTVSLGGRPGRYDLVVEGRLGSGADHASRAAQYRIGIAADGSAAQSVSGDFSDRWSERRSGRRGVSSVHVSHTEREHLITSDTGADLRLSLDSLSPGASDVVGVHLYRETFPARMFIALGAALTLAAVVIDGWRFTDPHELLLTTITLGTLLSVASFRRFAPPHPGFGDLAFNGAVGAVAGTVAGRLLSHAGRLLRGQR